MEEEDTREYVVLVNCEEQYSLWLADLDIPKGWREVFARKRAYKTQNPTCMRVLGVRRRQTPCQAFVADVYCRL